MPETNTAPAAPKSNLFSLLKPYKSWIIVLIVLTIVANALNLVVPKIIAKSIDTYNSGGFVLGGVIITFGIISFIIFVLTYLQSVTQTYVSEKVARDLRVSVVDKISKQEYATIQELTPSKLLTNLTSDVDSVKNFVSMAIASIVSSAFLIVGASILLLMIDWELGLAVLTVVPVIGITFYVVLSKVRKLFRKQQETIDWLNKVINESILGAALIRLINSQNQEYQKFLGANAQARDIGLNIVRLFAKLIPTIIFATNIATLIIVTLGGHFVITGAMTIGNFTAFTSYLIILIFPILIIGFMSNVIAQAQASYTRIAVVLESADKKSTGNRLDTLKGAVEMKDITVVYGEKTVLKNVSWAAAPGTRTAIIGPTAAGKTQLLYVLTNLLKPKSGTVLFDGHNINEYEAVHFHNQVGFVFQDSVIFNVSLRENIGFNSKVSEADLKRAIDTAELNDFIDALPEKLDTVVSERGTSLSGGQKQRIMLARALALNPKVLLLDDFTARVDTNTEKKILDNVKANYPGITLISVTQKIAPVEDYDQIILLEEGELIASGTHQHLMDTSTEYVQIFDSQQSTNAYELHA